MDGPEARQRLARERDRREIPARRAEGRLAGQGGRRVLGAGGGERPGVRRRLRFRARLEDGDLRARQGGRDRAGPVPRRADRQATLVGRVPGPVHGLVPDRPAGDADRGRRPRLLRRGRGPPVVPGCRDGQGRLAEGLHQGLWRQDAAMGVRGAPARGRRETHRHCRRRRRVRRGVRQEDRPGTVEEPERRRARVQHAIDHRGRWPAAGARVPRRVGQRPRPGDRQAALGRAAQGNERGGHHEPGPRRRLPVRRGFSNGLQGDEALGRQAGSRGDLDRRQEVGRTTR